MGPPQPASELNYAHQIRYWRRGLKTYLPNVYTGNDANRMTLALFIVSALDILGDLNSALSKEERQGYIDWVYACQLPEGGFRPWPGSHFGKRRNDENKIWDPAHVPGTFFALLNLVVLGDDLERVKRREILLWLNKLQRPEGSFGETLGEDGSIHGGNDSRFGYMATAIRWILRGDLEGPLDGVPDIDVDAFVKCVCAAESYDGGISEAPFHEAHAGFTSCAIAALFFVDRLPLPRGQASDGRVRGVTDLDKTLHWLASRQTATLEEDDSTDTFDDESDTANTCHDAHSFVRVKGDQTVSMTNTIGSQPKVPFDLTWVGMNGRSNKIADTCYAYWVSAPLAILNQLPSIISPQPIRRYLLDKTQHAYGGFGKVVDDPPDVFHSFLGLMVLAMFGEPGLQNVDAALCITERAKDHLESLPWRKEAIASLLSSTKRNGVNGTEQSS
ncbi:hypothetical protein E8E13_003984 [Curvularia kusanoi]|uniref:Prenyltransferase alpha-alpha toroid domain-containing protein n=1 Tax=Curvularia kusanoi TaxID=90978 RepID=A0A9P4W442_CURKU|nr:hypothetical protein E8E13_003984 [Curvularia kusanoi]